MIYLPKQVCLIIVHRNTTHVLDMSCCHKHQQQRYHNENTKTFMFIHYMYVDILFHLVKVIPIMFEHVTTYYQTWIGHNATYYQTWIGHNATLTRYHTHYRTFSFSLAWFGGYLQQITTRYHQIYIKMYINIF